MKWTQLFNNKILNRGEKYALEKRVEILRKDEKQINAKVYGSKNYEVEIKFYGDKIEKMSCNCPYASTANCKHLAATLYTIYGVKELKHARHDVRRAPQARGGLRRGILFKQIKFCIFL